MLASRSVEVRLQGITAKVKQLTAEAESRCAKALATWAKDAFAGGAGLARSFAEPRQDVVAPRAN
eukprot:3886529-Pyramimonas_sp.AAC.1